MSSLPTKPRTFHEDKTLPKNGEVFVFGSNLAGVHGLGAALVARNKFGAALGVGIGYQVGLTPSQHSYAIPTKNKSIKTLPLDEIQQNIQTFIEFTKTSSLSFFLTRVGCGLAGYRDGQIAPMFKECGENVSFPSNWARFL